MEKNNSDVNFLPVGSVFSIILYIYLFGRSYVSESSDREILITQLVYSRLRETGNLRGRE